MSAEHDVFPRAASLAVHELRTPVTVVAGYLRMVLREQAGPLTEKQRKMLDEAERSCGRLSALIAELSELGKLEGGELALASQEIDVAALLAELASGMHEGEDRGVRLETRGVDQPVMVTGDRTRLTAAIKALLHAALRERGEPGVIIAHCETRSIAGASHAVIAIGDDSVIPALLDAAATPPLFEEWRGGTGLALPVARRVIQALGGALWSAPNPSSAPGAASRAAAAFRLPLRT